MPDRLKNMARDDKGQFLKRMEELAPERKAAELALHFIRTRTEKGRDRNQQFMARYADSTIKRKRRLGQRTSPPNLRDSGKMMDGLRIHGRTYRRASDGTKSVAIIPRTPRDRRIMGYHITGTKRMPRRDIWGLTRRERAIIDRNFGAAVEMATPRSKKVRIRLRVPL